MRNKEIEIKWEAADGYCGGARPQATSLYLDDFDPDMTDDEIEEHIYESVQEDFEQKVYPEVRMGHMADVIKQIREYLDNRSEDE